MSEDEIRQSNDPGPVDHDRGDCVGGCSGGDRSRVVRVKRSTDVDIRSMNHLVVGLAEQRRRHREIREKMFPPPPVQFVKVPVLTPVNTVQSRLQRLHMKYQELNSVAPCECKREILLRKVSASVFDISEWRLMSPGRAASSLIPRQMTMAYAVLVQGLPSNIVGRAFNRDSSTVLSAVAKYRSEVEKFKRIALVGEGSSGEIQLHPPPHSP